MTLLEYIAKRLGFERPAQQGIEIIVFRDQRAALRSGMQNGVLPGHYNVRAWWPGQGIHGLSCLPIWRVTVPSDMLMLDVSGEGRLGDLLRKRQMVYGRDAVWIEL